MSGPDGHGLDRGLDRAEQLIELGRWEEACDVARRCVAADPDDADAHLVLVQTYLGLGDRAALATARDAVRLAPDHAVAWAIAARAAAVQRRAQLARHYAIAAVRLAPDSAFAHRTRAWIELTNAVTTGGLEAAATAVRLEPDTAEGHRLRGALLLARGRFEESEAELRTALRIDPGYAEAVDDLARLDLQRARPIAAAARFTTALAAAPDDRRTERLARLAVGRLVVNVHTVLALPALWLLFDFGHLGDKIVSGATLGVTMATVGGMAVRLDRAMPVRGSRLFAAAIRRDRLLLVIGLVTVLTCALLYAVALVPDVIAGPVNETYQWTVVAGLALRVLRRATGRAAVRALL